MLPYNTCRFIFCYAYQFHLFYYKKKPFFCTLASFFLFQFLCESDCVLTSLQLNYIPLTIGFDLLYLSVSLILWVVCEIAAKLAKNLHS